MITSRENLKLKRARALLAEGKYRQQEQAFVVEGVRLVEEALACGWPVDWLIYSADLGERGRELVKTATSRGIPCEEATPAVLASASDTQSPQGILAVLPVQPSILPERPNFVLVVDEVRDPGNLGTMLRSAAAAGVQAVLLSPGCVDEFSPKVLRSAMGAHFHLRLLASAWPEISAYLAESGLNIFLADVTEGQPYYRADLRCPTALLIGGEAAGAGLSARKLATSRIHIPMPGRSESLNAAIAASILMFEVVRQRAS